MSGLPIDIIPVGTQPVTISGKKTMPSKSILDPSFEYRSDCKTFRQAEKQIRVEEVKDCLALLNDAWRRLRMAGYTGDTTIALDILAVIDKLEKL